MSCSARVRASVATTSDAPIVERIRAEVATKAPDLAPWLPLLATVFDVEIAPTPEVELLAENNRRAKLHETVARFLETVVPDKLLVEIDDVHHMDEASAELLGAPDGRARRAVVAVRRRASRFGHRIRGARDARGDSDRTQAASATGCAAAGAAGDRAAVRFRRMFSTSSRRGRAAIRSSCATSCARRSNPAASRTCPSPRKPPR